MTDTDVIRAIRARHADDGGPVCECGQYRPCDTAHETARADRAEMALNAHWNGEGVPGCPYCDRQNAIDAKNAALAREKALVALITTGADLLEAILTSEWSNDETRNAAVRLWRRDAAIAAHDEAMP